MLHTVWFRCPGRVCGRDEIFWELPVCCSDEKLKELSVCVNEEVFVVRELPEFEYAVVKLAEYCNDECVAKIGR